MNTETVHVEAGPTLLEMSGLATDQALRPAASMHRVSIAQIRIQYGFAGEGVARSWNGRFRFGRGNRCFRRVRLAVKTNNFMSYIDVA